MWLASALLGTGIPELWKMISDFFVLSDASGQRVSRRHVQAIEWMHALIVESLRSRFYASAYVRKHLNEIENAVRCDRLPPAAAALELLRGEE